MSKGFAKGKFKGNYMTEYDEVDNYFINKGKGKKGNYAKWTEAQMWAKGKTSKSKGKGYSRPPAGMFFGGLEMMDVKDVSTTTSASALLPNQGLIDCGATASAGPLVAVDALISSVLAKDCQAVIDIQKNARPYFRFGNGQWDEPCSKSTSPQKFLEPQKRLFCMLFPILLNYIIPTSTKPIWYPS